MQEMWMALIFQTLTSLRLKEFLPKDAKILWSGNHLNVALPLWQGFTGNEEQIAAQDAYGGRVSSSNTSSQMIQPSVTGPKMQGIHSTIFGTPPTRFFGPIIKNFI
ncbi:hypothetical protein BO71DRAFT_400268 [Aspergillus ellipticus CBS 707.79]|uniref:Uncharacterized protein n=1 Tax=Aspergillus ellipticus CBS 707.79 TaxID=1448320 RepID=A0A319DEZ7_9EURO|nr:hypothetical protein BO71DRAFT_400268 [Aspergillus ellipticus CBS 707.79]